MVQIHGKERLEGVTIAAVDGARKPIPGTEEYIPCDTLLLSVGLIPENELSKCAGISLDRITSGAVVDQNRQTSVEGIYACGNVLHVHDLVDYVSEESEIAGRSAAAYIKAMSTEADEQTYSVHIPIKVDGKIRYTVPQVVTEKKDFSVYFRVADVFHNVTINVYDDKNNKVFSRKKLKVAPGEMENILLKSSILENASELRFEMEV